MKLLLIILFFDSVSAALISKSVGFANKQVVTSREVEIDAMIEHALLNKNQKLRLPLRPKLLVNQTSKVLLDLIVFAEAKSFNVTTVGMDEIEKEKQRILKKIQSSHFFPYWKKQRVSNNEMLQFVKRKLNARAFIEFKKTSSELIVDDAQVLDFYRKNRLSYIGRNYLQVKESIRTRLKRTRAQDLLRSWFSTLREKYKVRNLLLE